MRNNILCFLLLLTMFMITACSQSTPAVITTSPREHTLDDLLSMIEQGNHTEAIQLIFNLRTTADEAYKNELNEVFEKAEDGVIDDFNKAVDQADYRRAISHYKSAAVLGLTEISQDFSLLELKWKYAGSLLDEGLGFLAIRVYEGLINEADLSDARLSELAGVGVAERNTDFCKLVAAESRNRSMDVPSGLSSFVTRSITTAMQINGTVTVIADRGYKMERGVGIADRMIGSGFFIDKRGYILTNHHIIYSEVDPSYNGYSKLYVRLSNSSGEKIPARVIGYSTVFDTALLKVEIEAPYVFSLSERTGFEPGDSIRAIGSPGGLENTVTSGIISAVERPFLQMGEVMQVDVPINPGNSGGPVLNADGELIGMAFAGIERFEGVNFAIPVTWISRILDDLTREFQAPHTWIGAHTRDVLDDIVLTYIVPGSNAYYAGMPSGWIISSVGGRKVKTVYDIQQYLLTVLPGTLIEVQIRPENETESTKTYVVAAGERPDLPILTAAKRDLKEKLFIPIFGMKTKKVRDSFWNFTHVVEKVYPGSPADEAGISVDDTFSIQRWILEPEQQAALLQIYVKRRKSAFLDSVLQLIGSLRVPTMI